MLLTASTTGAVLALAPATAQAAPDDKLTITEVTVGSTSVAVSGLATKAVPIRVKGKYDSADPADKDLSLTVYLQRTGGGGSLAAMASTNLRRVSGTTQNGEWSGQLNVPSTANGTFKVTGVATGPYGAPFGGMPFDPTLYDGPSLTVAGQHQPKLSAKVSPSVVQFGAKFSITWTIIDSATGKPYGTKIPVLLGTDTPCAEGGGTPVSTGVNGIVTKAYPSSAGQFLNCLQLPTDPYNIAALSLFVPRPGIVAAAPSVTKAKVGTLVPVNGTVAGPPVGCKVALQRLYGASQWRDVSAGTVRSSGRFTVTAQPPYVGFVPYRVSFPACHEYQAGISRTFTIQGL